MCRVSVILPVYNGAKTIRETIDCALRQSFADFELIVVDDGSHDSTLAIVGEFRDPRLKVRTYPNAGLAASRNRGVHLSRGELLAFLDADDIWLPEKLEAQVAALDEHPDAALAYVWTDYIDEEGRLIHRGQRPSHTGWVRDALLLTDFIETGSNPVVRRRTLLQCGGFDESLQAAEDWDLWLRLATRHPFVVVKRPLVLYRIHQAAMSSADVLRQERSSLAVIERAFHSSEAPQHLRRLSVANLYLYLTTRALTPPLRRESARIGLRFLRSAVRLRPSFLIRSIFPVIALLKIAAALLLPARIQALLLDSARSLRHTLRRVSRA
jgi:glycosyltransferase involved in cell wall biosynthesis